MTGFFVPDCFKGLDDATRHRTDISTAVAADFRFVANAAQRYTAKLTVHRLGDRFDQTGFAHAGRSDQTQNRTGRLFSQFAYGQILEDALFYLVEAIVVLGQDIVGTVQIQNFFGTLAPGQRDQHI